MPHNSPLFYGFVPANKLLGIHMHGTTILANPPGFKTFRLAHRIEHGKHIFEVAYGSSFNELYYEFTPDQFFGQPDEKELSLQFKRAGLEWLLPIIDSLSRKNESMTTDQLIAMASRNGSDA